MGASAEFWIYFNVGVILLLALDLFVFHRKPHKVSLKEATFWSLFWISISLLFGWFVWEWQGPQKGLEFFTGYLIEKSLSVDNIFLFVIIFSYFGIDEKLQHRLLFWGIIGALIMRALMILIGIELVSKFHWVLYLFGIFLVYTGAKLFFSDQKNYNPEKNIVIKIFRKLFPIVNDYQGDKFVIKINQRWSITPYFLTLITIETMDAVFALDSIPAIFAVTQDAFIVYTSNVGAILGLRSLYFLLAGIIPKFIYLQKAVSLILLFVGIKMLINDFYKIPTHISLGIIILGLAFSIVASICSNRKSQR